MRSEPGDGDPATQPQETDEVQMARPYTETSNTPTLTGPYAQDPEFATLLDTYALIREQPLSELERQALAELPPADVLAWVLDAGEGQQENPPISLNGQDYHVVEGKLRATA